MGGPAPVKPQTTEYTAMRPSHPHKTSAVQRMGMGLLMTLASSLVLTVHATESSAAAAAIAKLLAQPVAGSEASAAAAEPAKKASITVLRGESLDRVIRRAMPQQPFKDEFVRKAFVQSNPGTLGKTPATRALPAGTVLTVPTPEDMMALFSEHYPALAKARSMQHDEAADTPVAPKRRWVQFP